MRKSGVSILVMVVVLTLGCGKEKEHSKADPSTSPKAAVPVPEPASNATSPASDQSKTTNEAEKTGKSDNGSKQTNESKPSALKIELDKLRAKGEPVTLEELNAWHKHPPQGKNAALAFLQANNSLSKNHETLGIAVNKEYFRLKRGFKGKWLTMAPSLRPKVENMVKGHQAYFGQLYQIYQRYPINVPARFPVDWTHGFGTLLPHLSKVKGACDKLKWYSQLYTEIGDTNQAVVSLLSMLRLCHLLDGEPATVSVLQQISCYRIASEQVERLLNLRNLNGSQLAHLHQAFASFNWSRQYANAMIGERCMVIAFEDIARSGDKQKLANVITFELDEPTLVLLLRSRTGSARDLEMTTYIGMMNKLIAGINAGYPGFSVYDDDNSDFQRSWDKFLKMAKTKEHVLKYPLTPMLMQALTKQPARVLLAVLKQQFTTTALAIERFRLTNRGRIPRNLAELTPKFLTSQPFDPYNGQPLRYLPGSNGAYELRSIEANKPGISELVARSYIFKVNPANRLK